MSTRLGDDLRARLAAAWPELLAGIAAGDLVRDVMARLGVQYSHVRAYYLESEALRAEWEAARLESADAFMDEAVQAGRCKPELLRDEKGAIVWNQKTGEPVLIAPDAALARVRADTCKWAARIRNPHAYSDRAQLDVNVKTIDLTRIISEANQRLAAREVGRVIDASAQQSTADALSGAVLGNGIKGLLSDLT